MDPNQPITPPQPVMPPTETPPAAMPADSMPAAPAAEPIGQVPPQPPAGMPVNQPVSYSDPMAGMNYQPPKKSKVGLIVGLIVVVLLVGGGAGGYFLLKGKSGSAVSKISNAVKGNSDVVSRSDGTLDLSTLIEAQSSIKAQDLKAKLNQQVNLSDGVSYMVTKVDRNFVPTDKYSQASAGKELIKVHVVVGNRNKSSSIFASQGFFDLKNSAGGLQSEAIIDSAESGDLLKGQDVEAGKQVSGAIIYQVDKNEQGLSLNLSRDYENSDTKATVSLKAEVALQ